MNAKETKRIAVFGDFENFVKISKCSTLTEVGDYTVVCNKKGEPRRVMCYSVYDLTQEEHEAAKCILHEVCKREGYGYVALNKICEAISWKLDEVVEAIRRAKARKGEQEELMLQREILKLQKSMMRSLKEWQNMKKEYGLI